MASNSESVQELYEKKHKKQQFNPQIQQKQKLLLHQLANRCHQLPYTQIFDKAKKIYREIYKGDNEPKKSAQFAHVSHYWLRQIQDCCTHPSLSHLFKQRADDYPFYDVRKVLQNNKIINLKTFQALLSFPQIKKFVLEHHIKDNALIKKVLSSRFISLHAKLHRLRKYPTLLRMLENPNKTNFRK